MNDFTDNLRLACSKHRSISEVCRNIEINRQQFNKYLRGDVRPSQHNLKKICSYLDFSYQQLNLPHGEFITLLSDRQQQKMGDSRLKLRMGLLDEVYKKSRSDLEKYLGYYFTYFYSLSTPGLITKSLIKFFVDEDRVYSKALEVVRSDKQRLIDSPVYKYLGSVALVNGAIYIREHETLAKSSISQTTLIPTYHNKVSLLSGLTLGVPSSLGRTPACSRIVFEFLGTHPNLRKAIKECGRYPAGHHNIPDSIAHLIINEKDGPNSPLYANNTV